MSSSVFVVERVVLIRLLPVPSLSLIGIGVDCSGLKLLPLLCDLEVSPSWGVDYSNPRAR